MLVFVYISSHSSFGIIFKYSFISFATYQYNVKLELFIHSCTEFLSYHSDAFKTGLNRYAHSINMLQELLSSKVTFRVTGEL